MTTINTGTTPNDGTGDLLRVAFDTVNANFDEVSNFLVSQVTVQQLNDALTSYETTANHVNDINMLDDDISSINTSLNNISQEVDTLTQSIVDMSTTVNGKASLSQLNTAVSNLNDAIAATNAALSTKIGEAPLDGFAYVRKNGAWIKLSEA
jgi:uncharacterized phage infection (PIP) family protein YhgE